MVEARPIERRWSARWSWAERAGAWDDEQWRRLDEAVLAALGPASENAAMTNASAPGATPAATVAAMVPGRHGRPFGMPHETDIVDHGDVIDEFLASGTAHPMSAARQPRAPKGMAWIAKSEPVRDKRLSESPA